MQPAHLDLDGTTVTVVDDSPTVRRAIESTLSAHGAQVTCYSGGLEALRSLPQARPDLILCDILLPDINGFEVCNTTRQTPALRRAPVVLISGVVDDQVGVRAREVGAVGLLRKPFTDRQLVAVVQRVLRRRAPRPETEADDPRAPLSAFEQLIQELRRMDGFSHGLVLDDYTVLRQFGVHRLEAAGPLAHEVSQLLAASGDLCLRLGHSEDVEILLQTPTATVLVCPTTQDGVLVVSFTSAFFLGQARMALRKYRSSLRQQSTASRRQPDTFAR